MFLIDWEDVWRRNDSENRYIYRYIFGCFWYDDCVIRWFYDATYFIWESVQIHSINLWKLRCQLKLSPLNPALQNYQFVSNVTNKYKHRQKRVSRPSNWKLKSNLLDVLQARVFINVSEDNKMAFCLSAFHLNLWESFRERVLYAIRNWVFFCVFND